MTYTAERDIQAEIMLALGSRPGVRVLRLNVGLARTARGAAVRFGRPGMADLLVLVGPRYLWIEVKSARGRQTKDQRNFERMVHALGGAYAVARSVDDAIAALAAVEGEV